MGKVIGIDLGTTNSVVAVYEDCRPIILENYTGARTTLSIVGFPEKGPPVVGPAARDQQVTNPEHTIYSIKRFMGRRHHEVSSEEKIVPYDVVGKPDEFVKVRARKSLYTPQEISALLLRELKALAEGYLGEPVESAIVTVPAYFNDAQRQATKDAGAIAGLKIERIINEPTAAALAYGLEHRGPQRVVVFDFGGGTFDLSALQIEGGSFKVLAVHGNTHLGGDDFDQRIIDVVADDFLRNHRFDIRSNSMALQRLKHAAQQAKVELSDRTETEIMLPFITIDENGPKHLQYSLTREKFEAICTDLFDDVAKACRTLMAEARIASGPGTEIVMVGGSTRMPKVQEIAKEVFRTSNLNKSINPDETVALGAAVLGGVIQGDLHNVNLMDVTSHSFGVESAMGGMARIVDKNTPIPGTVSRVFSTPRDNQTSVPVNVLEGESNKAGENRTLGLFQLKGIRKAPRGVPQIEVSFEIDANGILNVRATDKDTGKSQEIVIKGGSGLDRSEIERMQRETMQVDEEKTAQRERVDICNHAEGVFYDLNEWLKYNGELIPVRDRRSIQGMLQKLDGRIRAQDESGVKGLLRKLDSASREYRKAG